VVLQSLRSNTTNNGCLMLKRLHFVNISVWKLWENIERLPQWSSKGIIFLTFKKINFTVPKLLRERCITFWTFLSIYDNRVKLVHYKSWIFFYHQFVTRPTLEHRLCDKLISSRLGAAYANIISCISSFSYMKRVLLFVWNVKFTPQTS